MSNNFVIADSPQGVFGEKEFAATQEASYFLELERLLNQVEASTTHYQILGLERSATHGQVNRAYTEAIALFYPAYSVGMNVPAGMIPRVERAFNKTSQAFSVLGSFTRRKEYDAALNSIANKTPSPDAGKPATPGSTKSLARPEQAGGDNSVNQFESPRAVYEIAKRDSNDNRRRCERFRLALPVRVAGHDRKNGKWNEMTETIDVSRTGLTLRLRRRLRLGMVLYLALPLPTKLRSHGYTDPGYNVYALVRRVEPPRNGVRIVSFEFLGEHPPAGYLERPWAVFRTKKWFGSERRRASRMERSEPVRLEFLTESMQSIGREDARTEDLSRRGFRVSVKAAPIEFDLVRVSCPGRNFECLAALRNRYVGKDGRERLCLQLIDKDWPL